MLKNAYFYGKKCKNRLSVGGSVPKTPVGRHRLEASTPGPRIIAPP